MKWSAAGSSMAARCTLLRYPPLTAQIAVAGIASCRGVKYDHVAERPAYVRIRVPKDGILWRSYDATVDLLNERSRPVLAFVIDHDGTRWPFLREIFRAMPKNEKLRSLLNGPCAAMLPRGPLYARVYGRSRRGQRLPYRHSFARRFDCDEGLQLCYRRTGSACRKDSRRHGNIIAPLWAYPLWTPG